MVALARRVSRNSSVALRTFGRKIPTTTRNMASPIAAPIRSQEGDLRSELARPAVPLKELVPSSLETR